MTSPLTPAHGLAATPAERDAAIALYRRRAACYDRELAAFEPIRREAVARLGLRPGQTVLDLGCGTGLSLGLLAAAVGPQGQVVGVEQCPEMVAVARQRVADAGPAPVRLLCSPVEDAPLDGLADAALFHFTHDLLLHAASLAQVLRHLRPGARVVATGLQWAPTWNWWGNAWVASAAWYSVASMHGLEAPWQLLQVAAPDLQVDPLWQGTVYLASGTVGTVC